MIRIDPRRFGSITTGPASCGRPMVGSPDVVVDLSSHNTNPPGVFDGEAIGLSDMAEIRLEEAIASLREFVDDHGRLPTANSWTEARMRPSEKTIRRRFGSFQKAVAIAGLGTEDSEDRW